MVHHREHACQPLVFLSHKEADCAFALAAEFHHAGRTAVNTELVLDGDRVDVIAFTGGSVRIHKELRNEKQRDSAHSLGGVG